jgi:hypothetical protein
MQEPLLDDPEVKPDAGAWETIVRGCLVTFASILAAELAVAAPAPAETILWPKEMHLYSIDVPPGWGTNQTDDGVNLQEYPPDKTCSVVFSYLKSAQYAGRSTDSIAMEIAKGARIAQFAASGSGAISGVAGNAYSGVLQNPNDNSTWSAKLIFVPFRPGMWAIQIIKWPQTATAAQQAACNAAAGAVTLTPD